MGDLAADRKGKSLPSWEWKNYHYAKRAFGWELFLSIFAKQELYNEIQALILINLGASINGFITPLNRNEKYFIFNWVLCSSALEYALPSLAVQGTGRTTSVCVLSGQKGTARSCVRRSAEQCDRPLTSCHLDACLPVSTFLFYKIVSFVF